MSEESENMEYAIRRIVTGHDAAGKAVIVQDDRAANQNIRPHGTISTLLWGSDETPAELWTNEDFGARDSNIDRKSVV